MSCTICLDTLGDKNKIVLKCGHQFHLKCAFSLFSFNDKKCPNCREPVDCVPESDIQNRLNIMEEDKNRLKIDNDLLILEYSRMNNLFVRQDAIHLLYSTKKELELKIKDSEILKLFTSNQTLKKEIRNMERNGHYYQVISKNNEIQRLKNDLHAEKCKNFKLIRDLDKVTKHNIDHADNVEKTLDKVRGELNRINNENRNNRFNSRISRNNRFNSRISRSSRTYPRNEFRF